MNIKQYVENKTRIFELTLRRDEYDDLDSGCPETGFLVSPRAPTGAKFLLYAEPTGFSKAFRSMPDGTEYFINIDLPESKPDRTVQDLENFLNSVGRIPIEIELGSKTVANVGYVVLKIEPEQR